jgi:ADP-ribose pyrophosphatase YjhB (NUDIX family)
VGGIIFDGDQVLLIRRGHPPAQGKWSIPGGVVQLGETLQEALRREMLEETSLAVEVLEPARVLDRIEKDPEGRVSMHFVIVDFFCQVLSGTATPGSDAAAAAFFRLEEMERLEMTTGTAAVIREVYGNWKK